MSKFGITERGDAGRDLSWVGKMGTVDMAVLITKSPTAEFLNAVMPFKDKVIIHLTCTGFGSTRVEPGVPIPNIVAGAANELLHRGFNPYQIVLRLDPIIVTANWTGERERRVLELFNGMLVRCRFSFMDMYPHVKERFKAAGYKLPYDTFKAPDDWMLKAINVMDEFDYEFEACAESLPDTWRLGRRNEWHQIGCISGHDLSALDISPDCIGTELSGQRRGCLCPAGKTELLTNKKCPNGCIYCYWKHN